MSELSDAQQAILGATSNVATPEPDWTQLTPSKLSDVQIDHLLEVLRTEKYDRAFSRADPEALMAMCFDSMFTRTGQATPPELHHGVIVCAGSRIPKSKTSHSCCFVAIDNSMCWESEFVIADTMEGASTEKDTKLQAATLVQAQEGMKVAYLPCSWSLGKHALKRSDAKYFRVVDGELEPASAYSVETHWSR